MVVLIRRRPSWGWEVWMMEEWHRLFEARNKVREQELLKQNKVLRGLLAQVEASLRRRK